MTDECSVSRHIDRKGSSRGGGAGDSSIVGVDRRIAALADGQHGVVSRQQLSDAGISAGRIDSRIRGGRLHRVHRGVYAVGRREVSIRGRWLAAALASGPAAVISHRSAGALWDIAGWSGAVEVTRASGWRAPPGVRAHRRRLEPDEIDLLDGIPVTSSFRTIFDLASVVAPRQLERALNEAEVRGLTDRVSIPQLLERHPGARGAAALRRLLRSRGPEGISRGDLEEAFIAFLDARGMRRPRLNAHLALEGRFFEADCLWTEQRLIAELDGRATHGTQRAFEADRERDRILQARGWRTVRVTWRQLHEGAAALEADLRALLESRAVN